MELFKTTRSPDEESGVALMMSKEEALFVWRLVSNMNTPVAKYFGDDKDFHTRLYIGMCDLFGVNPGEPNTGNTPYIDMPCYLYPLDREGFNNFALKGAPLPLRYPAPAETSEALSKAHATIKENHAAQVRMSATISAQTKEIEELRHRVSNQEAVIRANHGVIENLQEKNDTQRKALERELSNHAKWRKQLCAAINELQSLDDDLEGRTI